MNKSLRAPFPWFGGKSRAANLIWERFGDVRNYVEPFAGSMAVLLGRPTEPKIETVNDLDCYLSNFWRAIHHDPEQVAEWASWPVNEADLHARHLWLVKQTEFRERMKTDPDFYDVKIAGWWVWGICQWIGSGWCAAPGALVRQQKGRADGSPQRPRPAMQPGGIKALITPGRTNAGRAARAVDSEMRVQRKRQRLGNDHGRGVLSAQIPHLSGAGGGIHASALSEKGGIYAWFHTLSSRLRRVRVCCGDWTRILGPAPTTCIGTTGVLLDPPYAVEDRADVYNHESREIAHDVREWAIANGDNPEMRIALCGYEGEHAMPAAWTEMRWKANGGFANQKRTGTRGRENASRERIWFSRHCLVPQESLFSRTI
jgi:site-specific DNA-adenine methylase